MDDEFQNRGRGPDWITRALLIMVALGLLFIVFSNRLKRNGAEGPPPPPPKGDVEVVADTLKDGMQALVGIAEKFQKGNITETFTAALPEMNDTGMGNLEVAVGQATERFKRTDKKTIFWDKISLGTTTTEIEMPVTYRYHLKLAGQWRVEVEGHQVIVRAPSIRASLPPAIHTDKMRTRSDRGWARFNAGEQMETLQKSITPRVSKYAVHPKKMKFAREASRRTVATFVKNWLLKENHWQKDRFRSIVVLFPDENKPGAPTLKLPLP